MPTLKKSFFNRFFCHPSIAMGLGLITVFTALTLAAQESAETQPLLTGDEAVISSSDLDGILQFTQNPPVEQIDAAIESVREGLLLAQKEKLFEKKLILLSHGAKLSTRKHDFITASNYWRAATDLIQELPASVLSIDTLHAYASFLVETGNPEQAVTNLKKALTIAHNIRDAERAIQADVTISFIHAENDQPEAALKHIDSALSAATALNNLHLLTRTYHAKGVSSMILGQSFERDLGHSILNSIQKLHEPPAALSKEQQDYNKQALEALEIAISYSEQSGDSRIQADALRLKGDLMVTQEKWEEAQNYYQEAYRIFSSTGKDIHFIDLLVSMAIRDTHEGNIDTAIRSLNAALTSNEDIFLKPWILLLKAEIALKDYNDPEAEQAILEGLQIASETNDLDQQIALNQLLALVKVNLGNYREAFTALDSATQSQVEKVRREKDLIESKYNATVESTNRTISDAVVEKTNTLETELYQYQSKEKIAWLMGIIFGVCCLALLALRYHAFRSMESEKALSQEKMSNAMGALEVAKQGQRTIFKSLAQELRTPMNGIVGSIPLMNDTQLSSLQENCVNIIEASSRSITTLINDISELSKIESGGLELENKPFQIAPIIETASHVFSSDIDNAHTELVCDVPSNPIPELLGDANRIHQIVMTLLGRAFQTTYEGTVAARLETLVQTKENHLDIRITVEDSSEDSDAEAIKRIFDFNPTAPGPIPLKRPTSMLGMSITQHLVSAMNGSIDVSSSNYGGMKIQVTIPLKFCEAQSSGESLELLEGFPRKRALIIDASSPSTQILTQHLKHWSLNFETAEDVNSAAPLFDSPAGFDVIFLDTARNGEELNVLEKIAAIRSHPTVEETPIILMSNFANQKQNNEVNRQLYIHKITKPFAFEQLHKTLSQAIHFKTPVSQSFASLSPEVDKSEPSETVVHPGMDQGDGFQFIPYILPIRSNLEIDPNLRILLAEDNLVNQKVTALMLRKMGFEIDIVTNGRKAVEAVATGNYDIVLMDKIMPVMDGLEATQEIRKLDGSIPQPIVIALTASASMEDEIACRKATMDNFLAKPIQLGKMKAALGFATRALNDRKPSGEESVPELESEANVEHEDPTNDSIHSAEPTSQLDTTDTGPEVENSDSKE